jgi:hypothetical protein
MTTIRIPNLVRLLVMLGLALWLTACGGNRKYSSIEPGYQSARSRGNLELPPDLVNTSNDTLAQNSQETQKQEKEKVLPPTKNIHITRNDKEGWLEVDEPADKVWQQLVGHWGALGVDLVVSNPKSGIMETDWVKPPSAPKDKQGVTAGMFDKFMGRLVDAPTSLDKYTMRLERKGPSRTRVYITQKGIKKIQTEKGGFATFENWTWVATDEDPNKVRLALASIEYGLENSRGGGDTAQTGAPTTASQRSANPPVKIDRSGDLEHKSGPTSLTR